MLPLLTEAIKTMTMSPSFHTSSGILRTWRKFVNSECVVLTPWSRLSRAVVAFLIYGSGTTFQLSILSNKLMSMAAPTAGLHRVEFQQSCACGASAQCSMSRRPVYVPFASLRQTSDMAKSADDDDDFEHVGERGGE